MAIGARLKNHVFPAGTAVSVYLEAQCEERMRSGTAPAGTAVLSGSVAGDSTLDVSSLAPGRYVQAAQVGGVWRYVRLHVAG